jgi:diguanylate cyclase (GGDEF)-like protein
MAIWLKRVGRLPAFAILGVSIFLLVGIGFLDRSIGADVRLPLFYVGPVALTTWYVGRRAGLIYCFLAAIIGLWVELSADTGNALPFALWNTGLRLAIFVIITLLLSSLQSAYETEYQLAHTDGLTGVMNWRSLQEALQVELARRERYRYPITVAFIDVDNFKQVNDNYGHGRGDTLLQEVAYLMVQGIRSSDMLGRAGGDEFIIIMPHTNQAQAQQVLPRLHHDLMQMVQTFHMPIGFSIGVVTYDQLSATAEEMISTADQLMYQAKAGGKNQIIYQAF